MNAKFPEISLLYGIEITTPLYQIPVALERVAANFPSPADDHIESCIDLNQHLIHNKLATFIVRANSLSMQGVGIEVNDQLVVDRSLDAVSGDIVIAVINNELTVKTLIVEQGVGGPKVWLRAENPDFASIYPEVASQEMIVWGVVTWNLKDLRQRRRKGG
jgi:DNA polymerase V